MPGLLSGYLRSKRDALVQTYIKGDVLDIGCGPATVAELLDSRQRYVGMEVQPGYIAYLRRKFPQHTFVQRDVDEEPLSLGRVRFDTVLMMAVIEHLVRPEKVIVEARGHMKPGSYLVISTPTVLGNAIHHVGAKVALFSREAAVGHKHVYSRRQLAGLLARCEMQVVLHRTFEFGANQLCVSTPSEWNCSLSMADTPVR